MFLSLFSLSKNWMHNVLWGCAEILPYLRAVVFFLSSIEIVPLFVFYAPFQLFAHTSACSEEAVKRSGNPNMMMSNPSDMENQLYLKAETRVSVLFTLLDILAWLEIFVFVMRIESWSWILWSSEQDVARLFKFVICESFKNFW